VEAKLKPRTIDEYQKLARNHVIPSLGKLPITDVTRADIVTLHHQLKGTPYLANRVLALLSKMFNKAEQWGVRTDGSNPCHHVERYREPRRERFLSNAELAALGGALSAMVREQKAPASSIAAIRLLIFTGARKEEIIGLRWDHVDFEAGLLRLPDSKSGQKTIVLGPPALEVLQDLPRIDGNPFVITGSVPGQNLTGLQKVWERVRPRATLTIWQTAEPAKGIIDQLEAKLGRDPTYREITDAAEKAGVTLPVGLSNVRLHDLRHSFASVGAGAGLSLPMIGKMLGHSQAATTQRYAHMADDPLRSGVDVVSSRIADAMNRGVGEEDNDGEDRSAKSQRQRLKLV
jgi:integrase